MLTKELNEGGNILKSPGSYRISFGNSLPDPEVLEKPMRRKFSVDYKLKILKETDSLQPGEISALLRREGLYWATFACWRRARDAGQLLMLEPKKRGRKQSNGHPWANKVKQLEHEKAQLQRKLEKAEKIIEVQKKISELLSLQQDHELPGGQQ
jgi:transposase